MEAYNRPTDEQRDMAYKQVAEIASKNGLISQAFGGLMVIMHPDAQKDAGSEDLILYTAGLGPHPSKINKTGDKP